MIKGSFIDPLKEPLKGTLNYGSLRKVPQQKPRNSFQAAVAASALQRLRRNGGSQNSQHTP